MKNRRFTPYLVLAGFTSALITTNLAFEEPVSVHADFGNIVGSIDYIEALSGADAVSLCSTPGGAAVVASLYAIYWCTRNPLPVGSTYDATTLTCVSGIYYNTHNEAKIASLTLPSGTVEEVDYLVQGEDFAITSAGDYTGIRFENALSAGVPYINVVFVGGTNYLLSNSVASSAWSTTGGQRSYGTMYYTVSFTTDNSMVKPFDFSFGSVFRDHGNGTVRYLFSIKGNSTLPAGDIDPTNPDVYINGVYRPWVVENYPEYIYLLPEPPQPESEYATDDIVPGIPKDWTIINPELPTAPHFEINVPDADFSILDVSDTIAQYVIPIGFWFTLLDQTLDALHLKVILYVALAFGLLIYIVWKLGR